MNPGNRMWWAIGVSAAILAVSACTSSSSSGPTQSNSGHGLPDVAAPQDVVAMTNTTLQGKKVVMVLVSDKGFGALWVKGAELGLKSAGIDLSVLSANYDPKVLVQEMQSAINQKPAAIIVQNQDLSSLGTLITAAQAAGIYVVTLGLPSTVQSDAYVGPDWGLVASMFSTSASKDCKAKGKTKVAIITGWGTDAGSTLLVAGANKVFAQQGMDVVATQAGNYDPSKAADIARTLLQQHPDLCAFVGTYDTMMLGVAKVVQDAGLNGKVGVYTSDSDTPACKAIGEGSLTATVDYGSGAMMPEDASTIVKYLIQSGVKAGTTKTALFIPLKMVDKSNYNEPTACYAPAG